MMPEMEQKAAFCTTCGGGMEFHAGEQKLICPHCTTAPSRTPAKAEVSGQGSGSVSGSVVWDEWNRSVRVLICGQCGAEVAAAQSLGRISCHRCGSPQMRESPREAGVAPEALMPFRLEKSDAAAILARWRKKRLFAPKALKTLVQSEQLAAVYSPFWMFDAYAGGNYTGEGGRHHSESYVTKEGKTRTRTKTIWERVSGFVANAFTNILVCAGTTGRRLLETMTLDVSHDLIRFDTAYLAGFLAEAYTVSPEQGFAEAREKMMAELKRMAEGQIKAGCDDVRNVRVDAAFTDVKFMHVLLPVWALGFTYRGKHYSVTIGGATGEIDGTFPKSWAKVAIAAGTAIVLLSILIFFVMRAGGA